MWLTSYGVSERGSLLATGSRRLVPRWSSLTTRNRAHSDLVGSFESDFPGLSSCNACPTATTAWNSDCPAHGAKPTITGIPESTYRSITAVGVIDVGQVICPFFAPYDPWYNSGSLPIARKARTICSTVSPPDPAGSANESM